MRVIVKREIFYGIQQGGRIDPKTGRLIKAGDTKDVTDDDTKNEPVTTARLARQIGKSFFFGKNEQGARPAIRLTVKPTTGLCLECSICGIDWIYDIFTLPAQFFHRKRRKSSLSVEILLYLQSIHYR